MGRERVILGSLGEYDALVFLKKMGYKMLEVNFRTPFGEIDLIAKHKDFIVFLEVKTRISSSLGPPYLSITKTKQKSIINNALYYLQLNGLVNVHWRIDVVSIKLNIKRNPENIELIENAVEDNGYY